MSEADDLLARVAFLLPDDGTAILGNDDESVCVLHCSGEWVATIGPTEAGHSWTSIEFRHAADCLFTELRRWYEGHRLEPCPICERRPLFRACATNPIDVEVCCSSDECPRHVLNLWVTSLEWYRWVKNSTCDHGEIFTIHPPRCAKCRAVLRPDQDNPSGYSVDVKRDR